MNWLTIVWSLGLGACLTLGMMHFSIWCRDRRAWAHLGFFVTALGLAGLAAGEMGTIKAQSAEAFALSVRLAHLGTGVLTLGCVFFVHFYFGTSTLWLLFAALGTRFAAVILNFATGSSLQFLSVESIRQTTFLGEPAAMLGEAVVNPWMPAGPLAVLALIIYVTDASVRLWRRGTPEAKSRALVVGGALTFFALLATVQVALVAMKILHMPFLVSPPFMLMVLAMGYELSHDLLRAARVSKDLRENKERLTLAAAAAHLALWEWNIPEDRIWVSESGLSLYGVATNDKANLQRFEETLHPEDRPAVHAALQKAITSSEPYLAEYRVLLPDGATRWIATSGRVQRDGNDRALLLRGVSMDVTERKEAEAAARESESRFQVIADIAPVMIWMADTEKHCTFANKGWLGFTGRTLEMELGHGWVNGIHPDDVVQCLRTYDGAFDRREPFVLEYRLRRHDGEYCWVLDNGVPRYAADGTFTGYLGTAVDVSPLKTAELEAARQRNEMAHLARVATLGELSGSLAHELNQPLAIVLSNAQAAQRLLAQAEPDIAEVQEILKDIISEDRRAGEVIKRLRALHKHGEANLQTISLEAVTGDVLTLMRSDLVERGVTVARDFPKDLRPVSGDPVQIQQVVLNLMLNGCDAMAANSNHDRPLHISARQIDGFARLSIQDQGCGLPNGETGRIFEPFYTTKNEGLGMGLAICRSIATAHGGRLSAEPATGRGSVFHLELPLAAVEEV